MGERMMSAWLVGWVERQERKVALTVYAADAQADRATSTEMVDRQCIL